jgi:hypothetical protein
LVQPPGSGVSLAITEESMPFQIVDKLRQLPGVKAVAPVMVRVNLERGAAIEVIYGIDSRFTDVTAVFTGVASGLFKAPDALSSTTSGSISLLETR